MDIDTMPFPMLRHILARLRLRRPSGSRISRVIRGVILALFCVKRCGFCVIFRDLHSCRQRADMSGSGFNTPREQDLHFGETEKRHAWGTKPANSSATADDHRAATAEVSRTVRAGESFQS